MPKGELSCNCGRKSVLHVYVNNRRLGYLCEHCARHTPSLRAFLVALSWLYEWRFLTFAYTNAGRDGLRGYLDAVVKQEGERAMWRREDSLRARVAWAAGSPLGGNPEGGSEGVPSVVGRS